MKNDINKTIVKGQVAHYAITVSKNQAIDTNDLIAILKEIIIDLEKI